jgi:hypothetical protein
VLRRILSIALIVVGVVAMGLAIASATVWRDSETVTASLPADPAVPLVVTAPGVLDIVASDVTIAASAPDGGPVVLVVGRETDVMGWLGDAGHVLVTGLASWTSLEATQVDGPGEQPSPAGSDMWFAQATGDGEATMEWVDAPGRWSLIAATDGTAPAPSLSLTWQREVSTPFLIPGLVVGGVLLLAGLALAVVAMRTRQAAPPELDPDAIRERLGAIPPRRKPGRHAQGSRPRDTYSGTELAGAEMPAETDVPGDGSQNDRSEEADAAGAEEPEATRPDADAAPVAEEDDRAGEVEEWTAGDGAVEPDEGLSEDDGNDDETATAGETNPEGEKA